MISYCPSDSKVCLCSEYKHHHNNSRVVTLQQSLHVVANNVCLLYITTTSTVVSNYASVADVLIRFTLSCSQT